MADATVGERHSLPVAGAQKHTVTCMLGFCPLMSALERSGKLCRSRKNAPGLSRCTLLPSAQGRVAGRWDNRCSGLDRRPSAGRWTEELVFAFITFCGGDEKNDGNQTNALSFKADSGYKTSYKTFCECLKNFKCNTMIDLTFLF